MFRKGCKKSPLTADNKSVEILFAVYNISPFQKNLHIFSLLDYAVILLYTK